MIEKGVRKYLELVESQDLLSSIEGRLNRISNRKNTTEVRRVIQEQEKDFHSLDTLEFSDLSQTLFPSGSQIPRINPSNFLLGMAELKGRPAAEIHQASVVFFEATREQVSKNIQGAKKMIDFAAPFLNQERRSYQQEENALLSLLFENSDQISSLKSLSRGLGDWHKALSLYHQLLTDETSKPPEIRSVREGSIELIVTLNADLAFNLSEALELAFKCYVSYLAYKKALVPLIDTYKKNESLRAEANMREEKLLEDTEIEVAALIKNQHDLARKENSNIDETSVKRKIKTVAAQITNYVVSGNGASLLHLPKEFVADKELNSPENSESDLRRTLAETSNQSQDNLKSLDSNDQQKLLRLVQTADENSSSETAS